MRGIAEALLMPRAQRLDIIPDILCRHSLVLVKIELEPWNLIFGPIDPTLLQGIVNACLVVHPVTIRRWGYGASVSEGADRAGSCSGEVT